MTRALAALLSLASALVLAVALKRNDFTVISQATEHLGMGYLFALDWIGRAFTVVGITSPVVAWTLVGCLVGGAAGAIKGCRATGEGSKVASIAAALAVAVGLLLLGGWAASASPSAEPAPTASAAPGGHPSGRPR